MGTTQGRGRPRGARDGTGVRRQSNFGPRNPDGTWVAGVERGPSKPFPFPVGARIGELTLLDWERVGKCFHPRMRCSCGWEGIVARTNLAAGRSTRCGRCARRKAVETRWEQKGYVRICPDNEHRARLLDRISAVIVRCTNPESSAYPDYGGRGIGVHPPWVEDRTKFLAHLVTLPGWDKPELQLDRRNNDRGYVPGNLRFCTRSENMANKRKIQAREVEDLKRRIVSLEAELARVRHRDVRAKK